MNQKNKVIVLVICVSLVVLTIGVVVSNFSAPDQEQQDPDQLLQTAQELYYQGAYQESIKHYQQAAQAGASQEAASNLATIYEELGDYQLAKKNYQQLVDLKPAPRYRLGLGVAAYNLEELDQVTEQLTEVVAQTEEDYLLREANYYLGLVAQERENYQAARDYFKQAVKHQEFGLAYYQLGEINFAQEKYQAASQFYRQALATDGSLKGVKTQLARSYLQLEEIKGAIKYFKQAKSENGQDQFVKEKLAQLEEKYPEHFESTSSTPGEPEEITKEDLPAEVDFEFIKPLTNAGPRLRVGIMVEQPQIFFRVGSDFVVKQDQEVIAKGEEGAIIKASFVDGEYHIELGEQSIEFSEAVQIVPEAYVPILVHNVQYGSDYYWGGSEDRQYRGLLELKPAKEGLTAVNIVRLEEYLQAVVPSEMSASWPLEALKVQSVAARSYTLANLGKHSRQGFDLCSTVDCAAYRGLNREYEVSNQAVQATAGEVMTYDGQPVNAVYSANSGGHTAASEAIWGGEVPYLQGVSTELQEREFPLAPVKLKEWLQKVPASYSAAEKYTKLSHYRWQRNLTVDYLEDKLDIADIQEITPTERGQSGSVEAILVVGAKEQKRISSGLRSKFGGLRSNRFWIQPQYQDGRVVSFLFYGSGWGHSVGMDQVAVAGMAEDGQGYQQILHHFYQQINLEDKY